jgi:integrase
LIASIGGFDSARCTAAVRLSYLFHLGKCSPLSSPKAHDSIPFDRLATMVRKEYARRLAGNEISKRHTESLENALRKLEARFTERVVSTFTSKEIKEWLISLPLATLTKNKIKRYASQIFNFAVREGFSSSNPMAGMEKFRSRATPEDGVSVYTVDEVTRLLNAADPEGVSFLALSLFCGIRRATLERLDWRDVRFVERKVVVPASQERISNGTV